MSLSVADILREFKNIEQHSPEDTAVLMTPLLGALEAMRDGRDPQLERAQILAITNSLAQTAAQAGDIQAAVAIANAAAELEQLPSRAFAPTAGPGAGADASENGSDASPSQTDSPARQGQQLGPLANLSHQVFGIIGIGALNYSVYLAIQARFQPGSVSGWLLTGSSSLLAVGLALAWRRFVLRRQRGTKLAMGTLVFAALATIGALYSALTLRPQTGLARQAPATVGTSTQAAGPEQAADAADAGAPGETAADASEGSDAIAFWWLGEAGTPRPTQVPKPRETQPAPPGDATANPAAADTPRESAKPLDRTTAQPPTQVPATTADTVAPPYRPPYRPRPQTPLERYRSLLDRRVVLIDASGMRHSGTLIEVGKHSVTLMMRLDVELLGEPIIAQRVYLFDNIETLRAQ